MEQSNCRIVFVSDTNEGNGAEKVMLLAASSNNYPIIFLKKAGRRELDIPKHHPVLYVSMISRIIGFLGLPFALSKYKTAEIVFSTHPYVNIYLGLLKKIGFLKAKLVFRECSSVLSRHNGFKKRLYEIGYRISYNAASLVICQTVDMKNTLIENCTYLNRAIIEVIQNPIDLKTIKDNADKFGMESLIEGEYICAAGRHIPEKGFNYLVDAFQSVYERFNNFKLVIIGDGPGKASLIKRVEYLSLSKAVIFQDWMPNVIPYFKHAKLCVVSSLKEGFPNVLLEMMAVNPNVISTCCAGGIREIQGLNTVPVGCAARLSAAIIRVINTKQTATNPFVNYLAKRGGSDYLETIIKILYKIN